MIAYLMLRARALLDRTRVLDFLPLLATRLYLVPVFWMAGTQKLGHFESTVEWFGNPEWGLGLPFPPVMAALAGGTEVVGAIALLLGLGVRWISLPLMVTMIVAIATVHWENGWNAIASSANPEIAERLERARAILQEYGNYDWLTAKGQFVILQNGVEFAVTYLIMLGVLFFFGAGRWVSIDHWVARWLDSRA
ncbi:MAG TPA: DoxX family protein [Chromatiales bacterium]|nr:DoxX family protein [Chromatiales bacterium]